MKRFKNILFMTGSAGEDKAGFDRAVTLTEENQASLTVASLLEGIPTGDRQTAEGISTQRLRDSMMDRRQRQLDELIAPVRSRIDVHDQVLTGTPFLAIIREVLRHRRDLVIKAAEEHGGIGARLFGSTDMHLLRKCPCPVWLMHPGRPAAYRRVIATIGFDPHEQRSGEEALNRQILELATSLALADFATLHIVHVWRAVGEDELLLGFAQLQREKVEAYVSQEYRSHERWLDGFLGDFFDSLGKDTMAYLKPQTHLKKGRADEVVPSLAEELQADLIVMGTVARTGVPGLIMGNTAETILNRVRCAVLAIKPAGFVTPVSPND